ncbi:MAG: hypothetical protein A3E87_01940 [Gammaproteobacteria bacterium RIFCSPHIGHO2_12_FULL_35_23]|nr:MAG: hypothetical protein A3E87_01940 [Gammaproteobacteria bacterium RIFCSPHIGHO2_12_FULL_35_23]
MFNRALLLLKHPISKLTASPLEKKVFFISVNILLVLFIINLAFPLEKLILINEIFSLFGLYFYLRNINYFWEVNNNIILLAINFLIVYGIIRAGISLFNTDSFYGYLRTLVLWYSMFGFFLGAEFIKQHKNILLTDFLDKIAIPLSIIAIILGNTISSPSLIPLLLRRYQFKFILIFLGITAIILLKHEFTLIPMLFAFAFCYIVLANKRLKTILFHPIFIALLILFFYIFFFILYFYFNSFYNYSLGFHALPHFINNNSWWRFMFWAYELANQLPNHLFFGLGFGSPLFNINDPNAQFIASTNDYNDHYFMYTLGTHNFLVYSIVRLGVVGVLPLFIIILTLFNKIRLNKISNLSQGCFFSFVLIVIGASFNVVIASPLYAGTFWIFLGMLYQSLKQDKKNEATDRK